MGLGAVLCRIAASLPRSETGRHVSKQLTRCGTAPAANYAEAQSAESRRDFVHKMKLCLKELKETFVWLRLLGELQLGHRETVGAAISEADELIAIFVASIATAKRKEGRSAPESEASPS